MKCLGTKRPNYAHMSNNLAALCQMRGDYEEAELLYNKSLEQCLQILGPMRPLCASTLNNLASLYMIMGAYDKARKFYTRALQTREAASGASPPGLRQILEQSRTTLHNNRGL